MYWQVNENVVTRGLQESKFVFPLRALVNTPSGFGDYHK